jgi:hypothetical protein
MEHCQKGKKNGDSRHGKYERTRSFGSAIAEPVGIDLPNSRGTKKNMNLRINEKTMKASNLRKAPKMMTTLLVNVKTKMNMKESLESNLNLRILFPKFLRPHGSVINGF